MSEVVSASNSAESPLKLMNFGAMQRTGAIIWPITSGAVSLSPEAFHGLLKCALQCINVDEEYYLHLYPDVVDALANSLFKNAHHHYVEFGYFEDRLPFRVEVDEAFYFWAHPDVKSEVNNGNFSSAQAHFELCGYKEGRLPREGWTLMGD